MRTKQDFDRQNAYNREHYDHYNLMMPKGLKPELQAIAKERGQSLSAFINEAIKFYLSQVLYTFEMDNINNMFYGNIIALCRRKNITIAELMTELSISVEEMQNIQTNGICEETTIDIIAKYFDISNTELEMGTIYMELPESMWKTIK